MLWDLKLLYWTPSVKLKRLSSPLKLRNTSYFIFGWRVEEEDGDGDDPLLRFTEAVGKLDKSTNN